MTIILGIKLRDKFTNSIKLQQVLTDFSCIIKVRVGINNSGIFCSENGIIILQIEDYEREQELEKALIEISNIELQRMIF